MTLVFLTPSLRYIMDTMEKKDSHISHSEASQGFGRPWPFLNLDLSPAALPRPPKSAVAMAMIPIKHRKGLEMLLRRGAQDHPKAEGPVMIYGVQLPPSSRAGYLVLSTNYPTPADLSQCLHWVLVGRHMSTKELPSHMDPQNAYRAGLEVKLTGVASTSSPIHACAVVRSSSPQARDLGQTHGAEESRMRNLPA